MQAALYRLLLALFHRVYGPPDKEAWAELWCAEQFPEEPLSNYLEQWRGRFDLFHPTHPFLQCPALRACEPASVAKLVPYRAVGNNATLFDQTTTQDRLTLAPAEAARWLVTIQAYDTGGLKTPYRKEKTSEKAPCNQFGCVLLEGNSLKETLLLNAPPYNPEFEQSLMTASQDQPIWEKPEPPSPEPDERSPQGWTDLLTWPSRRILLFANESNDGQIAVNGVVLTPGIRLRGELRYIEHMAAFRRPYRKEKAAQDKQPWLPVLLQERRGIWRHSRELLLATGEDSSRGHNRQRPFMMDHVAEQIYTELIPSDTEFTMRVFGQQLDRNGGAIEAWLEETLPVPVALLRTTSLRVESIIGFAVGLADDVGSALKWMESQYNKAQGAEARHTLELAYWPRLSEPFADFLRRLADAIQRQASETPATNFWMQAVRSIARSTADSWAYDSPRQGRSLLVAAEMHSAFTGILETRCKKFCDEVAGYTNDEDDA